MPTTVITGSASGIGAATRDLMLAAGHRVIGVDLNNAEITADLSTAAGRILAVGAVLQACGGTLDHLVCNAGLGPTQIPARIAAVNYFGTTALLDGLFAALQKGNHPSVVAVASVASVSMDFRGHPLREAFLSGNESAALDICAGAGEMGSMLAYAGSKHAVVCDVRRRAIEWGKAGVRINAVAPGPVATPLLRECVVDERFRQNIGEFVPPVGRQGTPQEIAELIAYLLSPKAGFIHASVQFIDGGTGAMMRPFEF